MRRFNLSAVSGFFLYSIVFFSTIFSAVSSDFIDVLEIGQENLANIRSCVLSKKAPDIEFLGSDGKKLLKVYNFVDFNYSVVVPNFVASNLFTKHSKIKKIHNTFVSQAFNCFLKDVQNRSNLSRNLIFAGSGDNANLALLIAGKVRDELHKDNSKKIMVAVFSPAIFYDKDFVSEMNGVIGKRNIIFFKRKDLFSSNNKTFPGVPLEVLNWEDNQWLPLKVLMYGGGLYSLFNYLSKSKNLDDSKKKLYTSSMGLMFLHIIYNVMNHNPYVPSEKVIADVYKYFRNRLDYMWQGIDNGIFLNEDNAISNIGKVSYTDPSRNGLSRFLLRLVGGY
jgi:hypothetical protein